MLNQFTFVNSPLWLGIAVPDSILLDDVSYVLGKGAPERFCKLHGSAGKPLVTSEAGEMGQKKLVSYMLNALLVL